MLDTLFREIRLECPGKLFYTDYVALVSETVENLKAERETGDFVRNSGVKRIESNCF